MVLEVSLLFELTSYHCMLLIIHMPVVGWEQTGCSISFSEEEIMRWMWYWLEFSDLSCHLHSPCNTCGSYQPRTRAFLVILHSFCLKYSKQMTVQNTAILIESVVPHKWHILLIFSNLLSALKTPFPSLFKLWHLF